MIGPETTVDYEAAGGIVTQDGRVLVIRRPGRPAPDGRPEVRLPKGHVEPGESHEQAARREVGEETGLTAVEILAHLGSRVIEFDRPDRHVVRRESYWLMRPAPGTEPGRPEKQFVPVWLDWDEAVQQLSFEAEREWVRYARKVWASIG